MLAGVSSFGIGGTNCHAVLSQPPGTEHRARARRRDPHPVDVSPGLVPWVLSGRSAEGLAAQAGRLREFVAARPDLNPVDVGWSLAATRLAFEHRAVVTGEDREELLAGLAALAAGQPAPAVITGVAGDAVEEGGGPPGPEVSAAERYVRGAHVDWAAVLERAGGRRVDLPGYAFQRERYWLDTPAGLLVERGRPGQPGPAGDGRSQGR